jgi:hypothetical protein
MAATFRPALEKTASGHVWTALRVGKSFLHVAGLVGAAICSAYRCGSHDRWR